MKHIRVKTVLPSVFILTAAILLLFICLLWPVIRSAVSVKQLEDGLYSMEYRSDYGLNDFLEQGGKASDMAVADFALADAAGRAVVVEYVNNEMSVVETPIATNFYLTPGEKYGIGTEESHRRYEILTETLRSPMSMDEVRDAMDSVSKHNFDSVFASTEWSIVFDQSSGEARYYHRENYEKAYSFWAGR